MSTKINLKSMLLLSNGREELLDLRHRNAVDFLMLFYKSHASSFESIKRIIIKV